MQAIALAVKESLSWLIKVVTTTRNIEYTLVIMFSLFLTNDWENLIYKRKRNWKLPQFTDWQTCGYKTKRGRGWLLSAATSYRSSLTKFIYYILLHIITYF